MARIAICGETYSENLGDGVIADSLTWLLRQADPGVTVSKLDFSGKTGFGDKDRVDASSANGIRVLHRSLARLSIYRKGVILPVWYGGKRNRLGRLWREQLAGCDLVLIGGGQLLMDNDLGFPLRIHELIGIARGLNKRVAFYACGVGENWSWIGLRLLARAFREENVLWLSVRDHGSRNTLQALFPGSNIGCNITVDPAVCAAEAYGMKANPGSDVIGLGISAPNVLDRHKTFSRKEFFRKRVMQFWLSLAELLASDRRQVFFFTNGQEEDHAFAESIMENMAKNKTLKYVPLLERARDPHSLISQVSQFRAIVAHRLHANVIAYSLGIPSVGLIWDRKVKEFGNITGRSDFYLEPIQMVPGIVKRRLDDAMSAGVDASQLARHKVYALRNVQTMLAAVGVTGA